MRELSIFVDESGNDGPSDRHHLPTVAMNGQSDGIANSIKAYEDAPAPRSSRTYPFMRCRS